jgi:sugar-specific transcriptional regulator TrmB
MKILNPEENISRIVTLVEHAEEFVVMVSPYTDLQGWDHLIRAINNAVRRGVNVKYYVRKEVGVPGTEVLEAEIIEVPDLHAKMFFSEKEMMISSFHLRNNDDINWAYVLEYPGEYDQMAAFFEKNIKPVAIPKSNG